VPIRAFFELLEDTMKITSPVTWFGGKSRLAERIISHFPPFPADRR
jgi:hypothetical protein